MQAPDLDDDRQLRLAVLPDARDVERYREQHRLAETLLQDDPVDATRPNRFPSTDVQFSPDHVGTALAL